jgi:hypothetical protein
MVVMFLVASAFDVFARHEPGMLVEIDIFPFGLQQLANAAQRAQADPRRELGLLLHRPNTLVLLTGGKSVVIGGHLLEAVMQFQQLYGRKDPASFCLIVGRDQRGRCRPVPSDRPRPIRPAKVGAFWPS